MKIIKEDPKLPETLTVELTKLEVFTLVAILENIGGSPDHSTRGVTEKMHGKLLEEGFLGSSPENPFLGGFNHSFETGKDALYFKDGTPH